jgi:hypothetical protein
MKGAPVETWSERMERQLHAKQRLCRRCGKVCYDSEQDAARTIRDYDRRLRARPYYFPGETPAMVPKRAYHDERCGTWHVTKLRTPRPPDGRGSDPSTAPWLLLPAGPAVNPHVAPCGYLEALTLGLRDAIREQGAGLRFPSRRVLERQYAVPWTLLTQARDLLTQTGWLRAVESPTGTCHVTSTRRIAETSRDGPASLSA